MGLYGNLDDQYRGESAMGLEVKLDKRSARTGNLYIETEEKSNPGNHEFVDSGLKKKG